MTMIPFNIADRNLVFITNSRPYNVSIENPNFATIRQILLSDPTPDPVALIELADIPTQIHARTDGKITVDAANSTVFYGSTQLDNVWTEKLLGFLHEDLPILPITLALESLQRNPSHTARTRLPLFQQKNELGFLPDGRLTALKAVKDNWRDKHSGTIDNSPGRLIAMPRHEISDDPNVHCHVGLHVGTWEYVANFASNDSDRIILCAFWPEHVVSVPNDMTTKIRVCEYETLSELDRNTVVEFINRNKTVVDINNNSDDEFDDDYLNFED